MTPRIDFLNDFLSLDQAPGLSFGPAKPMDKSKWLVMEALLRPLDLPMARKSALLALFHLWQDRWEEAHALAQDHEGESDCDWAHAIGHRREGDFSNSKYWFDEAGNPEALKAIARAVDSALDNQPHTRSLLVRDDLWQPKAFVDLVRNQPRNQGLIQLQALEIRALAAFWWPFPPNSG